MSTSDDFDGAFPELFREAYRTAYRLLGDRDEASDVAQEACARACVRWRRLTAKGPPAPWVVRVSSNLALDRWRRLRTADKHAAALANDRVEFDEGATRVDLHRALAVLPKRQREVVVLRYVADLSEQDVAFALGCAPGTVKSHATRGLTALRAALGENVEEV